MMSGASQKQPLELEDLEEITLTASQVSHRLKKFSKLLIPSNITRMRSAATKTGVVIWHPLHTASKARLLAPWTSVVPARRRLELRARRMRVQTRWAQRAQDLALHPRSVRLPDTMDWKLGRSEISRVMWSTRPSTRAQECLDATERLCITTPTTMSPW